MYFIQNVLHLLLTVTRIVNLFVLAFGYIKLSFKPIISKTETQTGFLQHYALKKNPIYPKRGEKNPQTLEC